MTGSPLFRLARKSILNRKASAILTILSIALSVALFLGVDKVRRSAEQGFGNTISGTDVIVGARTGSINLLLYSVFRIGEATSNISWESYEKYKNRPEVEWTIPLSLGDSHRGYRVIGTTTDYFTYFRYGNDQALTFRDGVAFDTPQDAVVGATVAKDLGYSIGDEIVISHGLVSVDFADHGDDPFKIVGILAPTGTPVDRSVHITLAGLDAVHGDFPSTDETAPDDHDHDHSEDHDHDEGHDHAESDITAFLVGLNNRVLALRFQRDVNTDQDEALQAILPGLALAELWQIVGAAEMAFIGVAALVVFTGLLGLMASILMGLNERRREMAVLRATGARAGQIYTLLVTEAALIATVGSVLGALFVYGGLSALGPAITARFGIPLLSTGPTPLDAAIILLVVFVAVLMSLIPAWRAYRNSLADGLTVKL